METQLISSRYIRQPENIPEEIVLDILSRLPVKSLLRFRCVCKVWKSLISDPKFTLLSPNHKVAIKFGNIYSIDTGHGLSRTISIPKDRLLEPMLFDDDENASKTLRILGSCNGLFLVSHYEDFYLWNPSTRESTKVLSYRTKGWPKDVFFSAYPSGLCYDSSTDDYKAVMVMDFGKADVVSFKRKYRTTVTLHACDKANRHRALSGPIVNEKLHWVIPSFRRDRVRFPTGSRIVSFNPLMDEFEEFPMPLLANNGEGEPIIKGLGVLDGCLCMTRCVSVSGGDEVGPGFFELLVMKEYGVGGSWTRILKVSKDFMVFSQWDLVPLCFTSDGEVVISLTHLKKLCAYNLADMSQRDIMIPSKRRITCHTSYVESLVSPAAYGHGEDWIVERRDEWRRRPLISQRDNIKCKRKSDL